MKKKEIIFCLISLFILSTERILATSAGIEFPGSSPQEVVGPQQTNISAHMFPFFGTIGDLVTNLLPFIFIFAGLAMLIFLIIGGFQLMTSAGEPKALKEGQEKITGAIVGFIIIFLAYWIARILETIFNLKIVS